MTPYEVRLCIPSQPQLLRCVREFVRCYVAGCGFGEDQTCAVVLAIDEACTNAIRHSYGGPCDSPLRVSLRFCDNQLEAVVEDEGAPVPEEKRTRPSEADPQGQEVQPGGLGLRLMHKILDNVRFESSPGGGNRVVLQLRRTEGERDHGRHS